MVVSEEKKIGETAKTFALNAISENIINLELKPGSLVSENELSRVLGVSRTPVREAIQELVKSQLIVVYPQRGSYVSHISFDVIDEAAFLRRTLETAIVEELCDNATDEQIFKLNENVKLQEYYLENSAKKKIFELDNEFHRMLFSMCNKDRTYNLMSTMMGHFDRVRALALTSVKDIKTVSDHRTIVEAIATHDKAAAREVMIKHLLRYKIDKAELVDMYPEYFERA